MYSRFCICIISSFIIAGNAFHLSGGEKEVTAIAKLFSANTIAFQPISFALEKSDQAFYEDINQRILTLLKNNPEKAKQFAKIFQSKDETEKKAGIELLKHELNLTDSEINRILAIVEFQRNPTARPVGLPIETQVKRNGGYIHFEIPQVDSTPSTDEERATSIRLLTSLKLRLDSTGAELLGCNIGPAVWVENTANDGAVRKGLEWQGREIAIPKDGIVLKGVPLKASKVNSTVWFVYDSKIKQTEVSIAIWQAGSSIDVGEFTRLKMMPASAADPM